MSTKVKREDDKLMTFLADLYDAFPGLLDGETDVNGGDLVDWLNGRLASLPKPKGVSRG